MQGKYTGRNDTMVELKTSMNIRGAQDEARFEKLVSSLPQFQVRGMKLLNIGSCSNSTSNLFSSVYR